VKFFVCIRAYLIKGQSKMPVKMNDLGFSDKNYFKEFGCKKVSGSVHSSSYSFEGNLVEEIFGVVSEMGPRKDSMRVDSDNRFYDIKGADVFVSYNSANKGIETRISIWDKNGNLELRTEITEGISGKWKELREGAK
jgi:hypothetical protein